MDVAWIQYSLNLLVEGTYEIMRFTYWWNNLLTLRSDEVTEQIEYAIFTREIYGLCGMSSAGFCTGVGTVNL